MILFKDIHFMETNSKDNIEGPIVSLGSVIKEYEILKCPVLCKTSYNHMMKLNINFYISVYLHKK